MPELLKILLTVALSALTSVITSLVAVGILERKKIRAANSEKEEAIERDLYKDLARNKALLKAILNFILPRPNDDSSPKDIADEIEIAKRMLKQLNFDQFDYFYDHERPAFYRLSSAEDIRAAYEELKKLQSTDKRDLKGLRAHISSVAKLMLKGNHEFKILYSQISNFVGKGGLSEQFISVAKDFSRIQQAAYEETGWHSREEENEDDN